jgi:hypothetical protein
MRGSVRLDSEIEEYDRLGNCVQRQTVVLDEW